MREQENGRQRGHVSMDRKTHCYRCLLREMDEEECLRQIRRGIELLDENVKAEQETYENRLKICKECDYLEAGTCLACGCYVELRAAVKRSRCPYKKW